MKISAKVDFENLMHWPKVVHLPTYKALYTMTSNSRIVHTFFHIELKKR